MKNLPYQPIQFLKVTSQGSELVESRIITEANVSLTVNGEVWLSFRCTPIDLKALAVGFLYNEGIIQKYDDIAIVRPCENSENIDVWLHSPVEKPVHWWRTSGCDGGMTSEAAPIKAVIDPSEVMTTPLILGIMDRLFEFQNLYREVGGVHCSMITDGEEILAIAEDIGRHNTLDKISGLILLKSLPLGRRILLTTGRISSDMLQKAVRMGASIVISRTSPSSLSIDMAKGLGITLIGYARRDQFNIYTNPDSFSQSDRLATRWIGSP